jgi:NADPH:quinone reductase-like Zn-dependent oxidoreductase
VVVHGAAGGVGHLAVQLARWRGAHVAERFEDASAPVDLVFDTAGGELLARSPEMVAAGGRVVSVAEEAPGAQYFIVEANREQLAEIARLVDEGALRPAVDSVFPLADARAAFARSMARGKRGKVVLLVADE